MARRDRHERQDHDREDAGSHAGRGRAPDHRGGQRRHLGGRRGDGTGALPVIAVELSSFQLHWSATVRPMAAVVLNLAGHHLDWHGDIESYARDKGRIYGPVPLPSATPMTLGRAGSPMPRPARRESSHSGLVPPVPGSCAWRATR